MISAGTASPNLIQHLAKNELAKKTKSFIDHFTIISSRSSHPHYKSLRVLKHVDMIYKTLLPAVRSPEGYSYNSLCKLILLVKIDLAMLLPHSSNASYSSSEVSYSEIIAECMNEYKQS